MVEVTQEDRNAAADILDEISSLTQDDGIGQVADLIRDGEYDDHHTVAQVAAHREAERERAKLDIATAFDCGHKEGVEAECKSVVDWLAEQAEIADNACLKAKVGSTSERHAAVTHVALKKAADLIARGDHRKG